MSELEPESCILAAWRRHEPELRGWLVRQVHGDEALAEDLLQIVFLKAFQQGPRFCQVERSRAWLFTTARHVLIDHHRLQRPQLPLCEAPEITFASEPLEPPPKVDALTICLPRALQELREQDADILQRCDLEGMTQAQYAQLHGLSIAGAKSRLQRARSRLAAHLSRVCQVQRDEDGHVSGFTPRPPNDPNSAQ